MSTKAQEVPLGGGDGGKRKGMEIEGEGFCLFVFFFFCVLFVE